MTTLAPEPLMVALVQAATSLPIFMFALPAGALADLIDRRRLLLGLQVCAGVLAVILAVVVATGAITPGLLLAVHLPARHHRRAWRPGVAGHDPGPRAQAALGPGGGAERRRHQHRPRHRPGTRRAGDHRARHRLAVRAQRPELRRRDHWPCGSGAARRSRPRRCPPSASSPPSAPACATPAAARSCAPRSSARPASSCSAARSGRSCR